MITVTMSTSVSCIYLIAVSAYGVSMLERKINHPNKFEGKSVYLVV